MTQVKERHERHRMDFDFGFIWFHFVVNSFRDRSRCLTCQVLQQQNKLRGALVMFSNGIRWNDRSNSWGHEEVIDQQREELEAILMLWNWIFFNEWELDSTVLIIFVLRFCVNFVDLLFNFFFWWRQQVAWRIWSFRVPPFVSMCFWIWRHRDIARLEGILDRTGVYA